MKLGNRDQGLGIGLMKKYQMTKLKYQIWILKFDILPNPEPLIPDPYLV
jgi:hypothetical protein